MILVDTSVWIDHLRTGDERLIDLLDSSQVLAHPFIIGELACGNLRKRDEVLRLLNDLPQAPVASHEEVLHFIESNKLMRQGSRPGCPGPGSSHGQACRSLRSTQT